MWSQPYGVSLTFRYSYSLFQINVNIRVDQQAGLGAFGKANELSIDRAGVAQSRRRFLQTQMRMQTTVDTNKDQSFKPLIWVQGQTQRPDDEINK